MDLVPMRGSVALAIGLLCALCFGAVEETLRASLQPPQPPQAVSAAVPGGHLGDRLTYATFLRDSPSKSWNRTEDEAFQVTNRTTQRDRAGHARDSVLFSHNSTWDGRSGLPGEASQIGRDVTSQAVSLDDRTVVASLEDEVVNTTSFFAVQDKEHFEDVAFGPEHPSNIFGPDALVRQPLLAFQQRNLTLGESNTAWVEDLLLPEVANLHAGYGAVDLQGVNATGTVAGAGTIGGRLVLDVSVQGCAHLVVTNPELADAVGLHQVTFLGIPADVPSRVCFRVDTWLGDMVPYPVLVDSQVSADGRARERLQSLAAFRPGVEAIAWNTDQTGHHATQHPPDVERSPPGQSWPADGPNDLLAFPLGTALNATQADPSLAQFALWRTQHPRAALAGAYLEPVGGGDGQAYQWSLTFGEPTGAAFVVQSQRSSPTAPTVQKEAGAFSLPAFTPAPVAPVTWTAIGHLYETAFPAGRAPNRAGWGFLYHGDILECSDTSHCSDWPAGFYDGTSPTLAFMGHSANYTKEVANPGPERLADHLLTVDAATGELLTQRTSQRDTHVDPLPVPQSYDAPPPPATLPPNAVVGPSLPRAAVAAATAFLFFLLLYFLPLVKWAGGHAMALLPGFTRLREEEILNNPVRGTMVQAIRSEPGITPPELQRLTKAGWSTVVYHLSVLERSKLVSSTIDGRHKRFFPSDGIPRDQRGRIAAMRNKRTAHLYGIISGEPGIGPSDLCRRLGVGRSTIYWHVERLERAGLIGRDRHHLRTAFFANPEPYDASMALEVA
ncbi:MAG: winged helix-turn-helix transcriptional regulator [Thermoplasmatota archaeon]